MPNLIFRALTCRFYSLAPTMSRVQLAASLTALSQLGYVYETDLAKQVFIDLETAQAEEIRTRRLQELLQQQNENANNNNNTNNNEETKINDDETVEQINEATVLDEQTSNAERLIPDHEAPRFLDESFGIRRTKTRTASFQDDEDQDKARKLLDEAKLLTNIFLEDLPHLREHVLMNSARSIQQHQTSSNNNNTSTTATSTMPPFSTKSSAPANLWSCIRGWENGLLSFRKSMRSGEEFDDADKNDDSVKHFLDILTEVLEKEEAKSKLRTDLNLSQQLTLGSAICGPMFEGNVATLFGSRRGRELAQKICNGLGNENQVDGFKSLSTSPENDFFLSWQDDPAAVHELVRLLQTLTSTPFVARMKNLRTLQLLKGGIVASLKAFLTNASSNATGYSNAPDVSWLLPLSVLCFNNVCSSSPPDPALQDLLSALSSHVSQVLIPKGLVAEEDRVLRLVCFALELQQLSSSSPENSLTQVDIEGLQERGILPNFQDKETMALLFSYRYYDTLDPLLLITTSLYTLLDNPQNNKNNKMDAKFKEFLKDNLLMGCEVVCGEIMERQSETGPMRDFEIKTTVHVSLLLTLASKNPKKFGVFLDRVVLKKGNVMMLANPNAVEQIVNKINRVENSENIRNATKQLLSAMESGNTKEMISSLENFGKKNENNIKDNTLQTAIDTYLASWLTCAPTEITTLKFLHQLFFATSDENVDAMIAISENFPLSTQICLQEFAKQFFENENYEIQAAKICQEIDAQNSSVIEFMSTIKSENLVKEILLKQQQTTQHSIAWEILKARFNLENVISSKTENQEQQNNNTENQLQTSSAAISFAEKIKLQQQQQDSNNQQQQITPEELAANLDVTAGPLRDRVALLVVLVEHMPDRLSSLLHPMSIDRILQEASLFYGFGVKQEKQRKMDKSVSLKEYQYALGCFVRIASGLGQAVAFETNNVLNTAQQNGEGSFAYSSSQIDLTTVETAQRDHFLFPAVQNIINLICDECCDSDSSSISNCGTISLVKVLSQLDVTGERVGDLYSNRNQLYSDQQQQKESIFNDSNVEGIIAPGFLLPPLRLFVSLFRSVLSRSETFSLQEWNEILQVASFAQSVQRSNSSSLLITSPSMHQNFERLLIGLRTQVFRFANQHLLLSKQKSKSEVAIDVCHLIGKSASLFEGNPDTSSNANISLQFSSLIEKISTNFLPPATFYPISADKASAHSKEFSAILSLLATIQTAHHVRNTKELRVYRHRIFNPLSEPSVVKRIISPSSELSAGNAFIFVKSLLLAADTASQHAAALNVATSYLDQRSLNNAPDSSASFDRDLFPFLPNFLTMLRSYFETNLYISCQDPVVTAAAEPLIAKLIDVQLEALHGAELFDVVAFTLTLHCASKLNTIQSLDSSAISDALDRFVDAARYRVDCIPLALVALSRLCPDAVSAVHLENLLSPLVTLLNSTNLLKTEIGALRLWANPVHGSSLPMLVPSTVAEDLLSELVFALARIPSAGAFDMTPNLPPAVLGGTGDSSSSAAASSTAEEHQLNQLLPASTTTTTDQTNNNNNSSEMLNTRINVSALIREIADISVEHSNRFVSGKSIARLMRGLSSFRLLNRDIYRVFSARLKIRPILNSLERSDVSLICSAFAQGKFLDEKLFRKMAERICFQIEDYNAADVVLCLRAFNTLHLQNDAVYDSLFGRACNIARTISATSAVEVLTILAHQGADKNIAHKTCNRLADCIIQQLEKSQQQISGDDIVKTLSCFAAIEYSDMDQSQILVGKLLENFSSLSGEGIQTLCALMIDRNWRDDDVLAALSEHALKLYGEGLLPPLSARCVLDTANHFLLHDEGLRLSLSESARSVSRDVPPPDDMSAEELESGSSSNRENIVGSIEE